MGWEEIGKAKENHINIIFLCNVYLKIMGLLMCTNVVEKYPLLFTQYVKATLDVQLLLPECPHQHRTGSQRELPQFGLLLSSRVGLCADVSQHLRLALNSIKLQTFSQASV